MKLVFVASLLFCSLAHAQEVQDMKLVGYEEVEDCKYPSTRVCHDDEHGQPSCVVILNEKCK